MPLLSCHLTIERYSSCCQQLLLAIDTILIQNLWRKVWCMVWYGTIVVFSIIYFLVLKIALSDSTFVFETNSQVLGQFSHDSIQ
jgi:hypothetical protein